MEDKTKNPPSNTPMKAKVNVPFKVKVKNYVDKIKKAIAGNFNWLEVIFHSGCIYIVAVFFGARHSVWTALASFAIYFLVQELYAYLMDIAHQLGNNKQ